MAELVRNQNAIRKAQDEVRKVNGKRWKLKRKWSSSTSICQIHIEQDTDIAPSTSMQHGGINGYSIRQKTRAFVNVWVIGKTQKSSVQIGSLGAWLTTRGTVSIHSSWCRTKGWSWDTVCRGMWNLYMQVFFILLTENCHWERRKKMQTWEKPPDLQHTRKLFWAVWHR